MTLTNHGHHIPGTSTDDEDPNAQVARCGGMLLCRHCKAQAGLNVDAETPLVFEVAMRILMSDIARAERAGVEIFSYRDIIDRLEEILQNSKSDEDIECQKCKEVA